MATVITHPPTKHQVRADRHAEIKSTLYAHAYKELLTMPRRRYVYPRPALSRFNPRKSQTLIAGKGTAVQQEIDGGWRPRTSAPRLPWSAIARLADISCCSSMSCMDRRVREITDRSADRKMIINAMNSGATVFMADLEDSNSPGPGQCDRVDTSISVGRH